MKRITPLLCAALMVSAASANAQEDASILRLSNKDSISGQLLKLSKDGLIWTAPWLEKPVDFKLSNILDITMAPTAKIPESDHIAIVELKNGDVARGQFSSITDDTIELNTWYAGKLSFNRLMVKSIEIEEFGPMLYQGPSSLDGWIQPEGPPAWNYQRSAFIAKGPGSIAKEELLPEECSISFTVQRKSDDFSMKVILFSDEADTARPSSGYEISFRRTSCYLRKSFNNQYIGRARIPEIAQNKKSSFEIRASRRTGKIALFIDGRLAEAWIDPNINQGSYGQALHFTSLTTMPMRISDIAIKTWDGEIDVVPNNMARFGGAFPRGNVPPAAKKSEKLDEDRMKLANGDSIKGQVTSIDNGVATLETPLGEISIPVSRMRTLALKNLGTEESMLDPNDIRTTFADGSRLTFRVDQIDENTIAGSSQNFGTDSEFGTAAFDLSAMAQIEFDIHNTKLNSIRSEESW